MTCRVCCFILRTSHFLLLFCILGWVYLNFFSLVWNIRHLTHTEIGSDTRCFARTGPWSGFCLSSSRCGTENGASVFCWMGVVNRNLRPKTEGGSCVLPAPSQRGQCVNSARKLSDRMINKNTHEVKIMKMFKKGGKKRMNKSLRTRSFCLDGYGWMAGREGILVFGSSKQTTSLNKIKEGLEKGGNWKLKSIDLLRRRN